MVNASDAKKAMDEQGRKISWVADKVGVKSVTLRRWLNGYGTLNKPSRILVAQVLGIESKAG